MTLLTVDPSLPLVWKDGRDLVLLSKADADPGPWALAIARAVLWQIAGQWTFDLSKGIDYAKILGEFTDRRYCEEQMRRGLSAYFQVLGLTVREEVNASNGQPDLIVEWSARIRDQVVTGRTGFLEGAADPSVVLLTASYDDAEERIALHFSRPLSPDYPPALEDWKLVGFEGSPVVVAVAMNGEAVWLELQDPLVLLENGPPPALLYTPSGENMRATNGARVVPFRVALPISQAWLLTDMGEPLLTDEGEPIYA